jgi:predicted nucleic-acid-binding Zn-ribbon protein
LELEERLWIQAGLLCDQCGYMEFYTQNPEQVLRHPGNFFESTEPEN